MKSLDREQTKQILEANTESLRLEFKAGFDYDKNPWLREKTVRAILAMSNTHEGGDIVIGVEEQADKSFSFSGVTPVQLALFNAKLDDLKSTVESFSSSPVSFEIYEATLDGADRFVIIRVSEFKRMPTICRKSGQQNGILEEGAIYIRTLKDKPSSVKLKNPLDVQDLIERSVDKEIANQHRRGWKHSSENLPRSTGGFQEERKTF